MAKKTKVRAEPEIETNGYVARVGAWVSTPDERWFTSLCEFFDRETIEAVLRDPMTYHTEAMRIANFVYNKSGIVAHAIDYMVALPLLHKIIRCDKKNKNAAQKNVDAMRKVLNLIEDETFIRDALHTEMNNGICFYYLETVKRKQSKSKRLDTFTVESIIEINGAEINASIITLPYDYTKIIGKRNGRYVLAFNLEYFDNYSGLDLEMKILGMPEEIRKAYKEWLEKPNGEPWIKLDNDHTICRKIRAKDIEPWGRPLALGALEDILYRDKFYDAKLHTITDNNNRIIYQILPEGRDKGTCALTEKQIDKQHSAFQDAVMVKTDAGGIKAFSVYPGTKIDTITASTDIFDDDKESTLGTDIAFDMGVCAGLLGATVTTTEAALEKNLQMITAQVYQWVYELQNELNYVINACIIQDSKSTTQVYYFPTSFANQDSFFKNMMSLYTNASGSMRFVIAASGVDNDIYLATLDEEIENGFFDKYKPHQTAYTYTGEKSSTGDKAAEGSE